MRVACALGVRAAAVPRPARGRRRHRAGLRSRSRDPRPRPAERTIHPAPRRTLDRSYDISVRLPPGYDKPENLLRRYPVVYFNDAPYSFPLITGVAHLADGQRRDRAVDPRRHRLRARHERALSRQLDYTPTHNPAYRDPTGGASAYLRFLEHEVLPTIERRYRANPERRALAGHSFGGLFAAHVLLTRPEALPVLRPEQPVVLVPRERDVEDRAGLRDRAPRSESIGVHGHRRSGASASGIALRHGPGRPDVRIAAPASALAAAFACARGSSKAARTRRWWAR